MLPVAFHCDLLTAQWDGVGIKKQLVLIDFALPQIPLWNVHPPLVCSRSQWGCGDQKHAILCPESHCDLFITQWETWVRLPRCQRISEYQYMGSLIDMVVHPYVWQWPLASQEFRKRNHWCQELLIHGCSLGQNEDAPGMPTIY